MDRTSWPKAFLIAACVHFTGAVFYGIFASSELQPWAEPTVTRLQAFDPVATSAIGKVVS